MAGKVELEGWAKFQRLSRQGLILWSWEPDGNEDGQYEHFGRFAARWHLASNLRGIQLEGAGKRTQEGYLAGLRVALAYSALEHLLDHSIEKRRGAVNGLRIPDAKLAHRLRRELKTARILTSENISDQNIRRKLGSWESGQDPDVLIVARALRHMFAHGSFTPYGLDITRKAAREALEDLAALVRHEAQSRFGDWLSTSELTT